MTEPHQILLSVVLVWGSRVQDLERHLRAAVEVTQQCAEDYEIVVVVNGLHEDTIELLRVLSDEHGIENLQVYVLTKAEDHDIAAWAGLENSLGDFVAVIDPTIDDIAALPVLLEAAIDGAEVVFARDERPQSQSLIYRAASRIFKGAANRFLRIDPGHEMSFFRVLSRKAINYMLHHDTSGLSYRWLPAISGLRKTTVTYQSRDARAPKSLIHDINRGVTLLVSSSSAPMRLVTLLALFGAVVNLLYSLYVISVAIFIENVAPGWITLSLQQSGMYFLFSILFLILGEYVLHTARAARNAPTYHVAEEFTSTVIGRHQRLNVEVTGNHEIKLLKAASLKAGRR